MSADWDAVTKSWKRSAQDFFEDYKRVLRASKGVAVFLFLSGVYLGLFPILELIVLGNWIDALYGARGISVWTSDVEKYLWYEIILLLLCIPSFVFSKQLSGVVKKLNQTTREIFLIVSSALIGLQAAPITVGAIILFIIAFAFIQHQKIRWLMSSIMIFLALQPLWLLADNVVEREILTGNLITWGGALLIFTGYAALRPYFKPSGQSQGVASTQ
ncbi:MAG: hypothetical protein ABH846_02990 [Patescibacteria group bacterium]